MPNTAQEYDKVIDICQDIFVKKMQDYGTAWRILRPDLHHRPDLYQSKPYTQY